MTSVVVIQARMGSTRLPGKVLRPLAGRPVLSWVLRAARAASVGPVVVATSRSWADDPVAELAAAEGACCVRGDEHDVLNRFLDVLEAHPADTVVRLTADCPLLDPSVIAMAVRAFEAGDVDYLSTVTPRSLPTGLDVEVVSARALQRAGDFAEGPDRSHVTSWLYRVPGRAVLAGLVFTPPSDDLRVTLDTAEDAALLDAITAITGDRIVGRHELVALLRAHPELTALNACIAPKSLDEG